MRVFVTGHLGYIGVHVVDLLLAEGHEVTGCDVGLYEGCGWEAFARPGRELVKDVREVTAGDLDGHDCVMHLAAISNDPMGELDRGLTEAVNLGGTVGLARVAKSAGVGRFLFSGSCSVYGKGEKLDLSEGDGLNPLTTYARTKVEAERELFALADGGFCPVSLRNATAFGHSPMLRIDLVVNNLLGSALAYNEIRIMSDGTPWRPLLHCRDIAAAFLAFMEAPRDAVHGRAINVGDNAQNYRVRDVADQVGRLVPGASVVFTGEAGEDPRDYRVSFDLVNALVPAFVPAYTLETGMEELHRKMVDHGFSASDFEGDRFVRLRTLRGRVGSLSSGSG